MALFFFWCCFTRDGTTYALKIRHVLHPVARAAICWCWCCCKFYRIKVTMNNRKNNTLLIRTRRFRENVSSWLSACPSAWKNSPSTSRIFVKFGFGVFFENMSRQFNFHENQTRIMGTLHEDQYTFLIVCRSSFLRMRNGSDRISRQNTFYVQ